MRLHVTHGDPVCEQDFSTHRLGGLKNFSSPQFQSAVDVPCTNFQVLSGLTRTCKLLKVINIVTLKRLASAVQLRPWPPFFPKQPRCTLNIQLFSAGKRSTLIIARRPSYPGSSILFTTCEVRNQSARSRFPVIRITIGCRIPANAL